MNIIFCLFVLVSFFIGATQQFLQPNKDIMLSLTQALFHGANDAVSISIGLIGVLALFLGMIKILEKAGFMELLSKLIYPLLRLLFPDIPANHPALGAMALNLSANMLGLGNAATPFGIKAMQALEHLNPRPGTATNAMVLFLAINTSSVTLLPTKVIALRVEAGSIDPTAIITTTLFATVCSTLMAILMTKFFERFYSTTTLKPTVPISSSCVQSIWHVWLVILFFVFLVLITLLWGAYFSPWIVPGLFASVVLYGLLKKINVYLSFVEGAKEGFEIAVKIIPFLVAILAAINLLRASGVLETLTQFMGQYTTPYGLPAQAIPMALMRPLSGSGSFGILSDIFQDPDLGPDSYVGYLASTMMGSTETTFYVLAVYFGAVQIKHLRHAIPAALCADLTSIIASVVAVKFLLG